MILVPTLSDIEKQAVSPAERMLARILRDVDADPDAVAFHSVHLRSHAYKQQAEADYVLIWRGVVVLIEVKGGGVRRHDGVWYSVDRRGDWHRLSSSPMEQARSAAYALREILKNQKVGWYAHEAVVVTPDIEAPPDCVDWKPTHWFARETMTVAALTKALDDVVAGAPRAPAMQRLAGKDELRARLFGEFTRMPVIDVQRGAVIEEQNRATAGQARVLSSLARNSRVLVYGGAGTGKSPVLVEAAKQEADQGRSVLVTFKSPALVRYFEPHVRDHAVDVIPFDELTEARRYEVVLIDEAQDMMTAEAMDRIDAVVLGGLADGRWRMSLDPNNQAHVDGAFDEDVAALMADEATTVDLNLNVRNTQAIVHVVQEYLGADVGDPGVVHGERVEWHTPPSSASVAAGLAVAAQLVADGAKRADTWIVDPRSVAPPSTVDGFIVTSPRFAKGLEAENVIVCGLPDVLNSAGTAAFYVAVTRARVSLHILATKEDRRTLQQLVRQRMDN